MLAAGSGLHKSPFGGLCTGVPLEDPTLVPLGRNLHCTRVPFGGL